MELKNFEGAKVPSVNFKTRGDDEWITVSSDDIFKNKTVVVFSLPGAFTPTCSSTHLPRYNELAPAFFENGVDEIVCLSVNDGFVMREWSKDQESQNIRLLPDGNGEFTEQLGMLVDKSDLGFGKQKWQQSCSDNCVGKSVVVWNVGDSITNSELTQVVWVRFIWVE